MKKTISSPLLYLTQAALLAAMYTVLTQLLAGISFGPIQVRVSELLTIFAVFTPAAIPGLAAGCFFSNLLQMGANPAGAWDLLLGPLTTLAAALLTRRLAAFRFLRLPVLATLPPVLLNALVVGAELTFMMLGHFEPLVFAVNAAGVAAGQFVACTLLGLMTYAALQGSGASKILFP